MKRWIGIILLGMSTHLSVQAQQAYVPSSQHLNDPDLFIPFVEESATFWYSAWDDARGGFYTNVARDGTPNRSWGTNKELLTQSRNAYAMVRAFQLTGNEAFLDQAEATLAFQYASAWDPVYGGWFRVVNELGQPQYVDERKDAFFQLYALLGPTAFVEATDDPTSWRYVWEANAFNSTWLWDDRPDYKGYFDTVARSGGAGLNKSFNATVDALTTHAIQHYQLTDSAHYAARLLDLADNIGERLVANMAGQVIGFPEEYTASWQVRSSERRTVMGHVLKTGWVLARMYALDPQADYLQNAQVLVDEVWEKGYDHTYGGPYKDFDRVTGQMYLYNLPDTTKAWWQMEQAITGGLFLYHLTGAERYLEMADETTSFFMEHFVDPVYAEVYADVTRRGETIPQWGNLFKGDAYKAGYHSVETGYYGYLYGHLLLNKTPATLYYRFGPRDTRRTVALSPIEGGADVYVVDQVWKDGEAYADFDGASRMLNLPAGTEGVFAVRFMPAGAVSRDPIAGEVASLESFDLYPNPSRGVVNIDGLPEGSVLRVVDVLGRVVGSSVSFSGATTLQLGAMVEQPGLYFIVVEHLGARVVRPVHFIP